MPLQDTKVSKEEVLDKIIVKDTGTIKGYGAYCRTDCTIRAKTFLGFYEGDVVKTRELLDSKIEERKQRISITSSSTDEGGKYRYLSVMDYVMSLDGGVTFIDGFDRYVHSPWVRSRV